MIEKPNLTKSSKSTIQRPNLLGSKNTVAPSKVSDSITRSASNDTQKQIVNLVFQSAGLSAPYKLEPVEPTYAVTNHALSDSGLSRDAFDAQVRSNYGQSQTLDKVRSALQWNRDLENNSWNVMKAGGEDVERGAISTAANAVTGVHHFANFMDSLDKKEDLDAAQQSGFQSTVQRLNNLADQKKASADARVAAVKSKTGVVGDTLADLGRGVTSMALESAAGPAGLALGAYGTGTQEARQAGLSGAKQQLVGGVSALGMLAGSKAADALGGEATTQFLRKHGLSKAATGVTQAGLSGLSFGAIDTLAQEISKKAAQGDDYQVDLWNVGKNAMVSTVFGVLNHALKYGWKTQAEAVSSATQARPASAWFDDCTTPEEVSVRARQLAKQYHPDVGGDTDAMTQINSDADAVIKWMGKSAAAKVASAYETAQTGQEPDAGTQAEVKSAMQTMRQAVSVSGDKTAGTSLNEALSAMAADMGIRMNETGTTQGQSPVQQIFLAVQRVQEQKKADAARAVTPILDAVKAAQAAKNGSNTPVLDVAKLVQSIVSKQNVDSIQPEVRLAGKAPVPSSSVSSPVPSVLQSSANSNTQTTQNHSIGAADAGFSTKGMEGEEKTSRLFDSNPYNKSQEYATAVNREDYAKIFRYISTTEDQSVAAAKELLYTRDTSGRETFLLDTSPESFDAITQELKDAPAWNGIMTDTAKMIQAELQGRSVNGYTASEQYVDWLQTMREHATATGQGVQANAKWSRMGNPGGSTTEMDALDNLEKSKLSPEEQASVFHRIVVWDSAIEKVRSGDTDGMKNIILDVAKERGTINGLTGTQSKILTALADKSLSALSFDDLKSFAYASTSALSTDNTPTNWGQKIKTIQILNMLSNPITPGSNIAGNTTFHGIDALAMRGAAILDMAISPITGTRSIAFEKPTLFNGASRKAFLRSVAEITLDVDMSADTSRYETGSKRTFKASGNIVERFLSALERNQAYLLNATDEFYKGATRSTAEGTQELIDSGKIKTESKTYAADQAEQQAKYRTFQDNSTVSVVIQNLRDVFNAIPYLGVGDSGRRIGPLTVHSAGEGDLVAPFTKVAGNLVSRNMEYSVFNAVKGIAEIGKVVADAATGKTVDPVKQARAVSDTTRGLTGVAIVAGFAYLAKIGVLRHADDEGDDDARALNSAEGMSGTQINLTALDRYIHGQSAKWQNGDTLVNFDRIQPLSFLANMGTKAAEWKVGETGIVTMFKDTGTALLQSVAELPVVQGIADTANETLVYKRPIGEVLSEELAKTGVSSVTPALTRGIAKAIDNTVRNVYSQGTLSGNITDYAKNSIPGLRETLPASLDNFGQTKTYSSNSVVQNVLNSIFSPVGVTTYDQSKVSKGLESLRNATGDASFYPNKSAPSSVGGVSLTFDQKTQYQKLYGSTVYQTMGGMMEADAYKAASNADKAKMLSLCNDYASQVAGNKVAGKEMKSWVSAAESAPQNLGISTAEYIALYAQKDNMDANGNGGTSKQEAQTYLDKTSLSRAQKAILWGAINKSWKNNPYA